MTDRIMSQRPAALLLAVGLLAGILSGCGGSGGGTPADTAPSPTGVDLSGVTPGYMTTAGEFTIAPGQQEQRQDVTFACAAGGDACVVTVTMTGGVVSATSVGGVTSVMDSQEYIDSRTVMSVDLGALTPHAVASSGTYQIPPGSTEVIGDVAFSCAAGRYECSVTVTVEPDSQQISSVSSLGGTVTASDATQAPDPEAVPLETAIQTGPAAGAPMLSDAGAPPDGSMLEAVPNPAIAALSGWDGALFERTNDATQTVRLSVDRVVVYSNQEAPTPTAFATVYPFDVDADQDNTNDALSISDANLGMVALATTVFQPAANQVDVAIPPDQDHAGTFDGASGTYRCTSQACSVSTDAQAELSGVQGDWHFRPDPTVTVDVADDDFMYFGYWMNESTDAAGQPVFAVAGLAGGTVPSDLSDVQQLGGAVTFSATYNGSATGLYARRTLSPEGEVLRRRHGQFTADATLTASFGGPQVAPAARYVISGTISSFRDGTRVIGSDWSVELMDLPFGPSGAPHNEGMFSGNRVLGGETEGDSGADPGSWEAQFFGPVILDDAGTNADETVLPSGVNGTFDAHFSDGEVLGAFGATTP